MWNNPQLYMVMGAALGAALVGLKNADRTYRLRKERKRRQKVAKFARQRALTLLDEAIPDHIQSRADLYRGNECAAMVSDLILGKDVEGTYYVARRRIEKDEHFVLCFDTKVGSKLEGFRIEPTSENGRPPTTMIEILKDRLRRRTPERWRLRMVWDVRPEQFVDDATLSAVGTIFKHTAGIAEAPQGMVLGVSIENRQILIHSTSVGELGDLDLFIQNAVSLRLDLIVSVRDSSATRPVKVSDTVRGDVNAVRKPRRAVPMRDLLVPSMASTPESPRAVPASAADPLAPRRPVVAPVAPPIAPAVKEAAAGRVTPKPGNGSVGLGLDTPRAQGDSGSWGWIVRDGKKVFEVPEPEEDVVVYVGHGR